MSTSPNPTAPRSDWANEPYLESGETGREFLRRVRRPISYTRTPLTILSHGKGLHQMLSSGELSLGEAIRIWAAENDREYLDWVLSQFTHIGNPAAALEARNSKVSGFGSFETVFGSDNKRAEHWLWATVFAPFAGVDPYRDSQRPRIVDDMLEQAEAACAHLQTPGVLTGMTEDEIYDEIAQVESLYFEQLLDEAFVIVGFIPAS